MGTSAWLITIIVIIVVGFLVIAVVWGIRAHRNRVAAGREDLFEPARLEGRIAP